MNPSDYYRLKSAEIKEADVRLVAACMSEHVGEANAVRIEALAARVDMGERQVRDILEALVTEHCWLIGAHAGRAGRWIIATDEEKWHVANELLGREIAMRKRRMIIEHGKLPSTLELSSSQQSGLF